MFSKELENSISSLFDQATKTGLQYITVEHLLLMIMEDFEVRDALKASNCNISALNNDEIEFSSSLLNIPNHKLVLLY